MEAKKKAQTTEHPEFPVNQELLESAMHAREEWRLMRDRMNKIEESKSKVSPIVYERVAKDYADKLAKAHAALFEKKSEIDRERDKLNLTLHKVDAQLTEHRHLLEELKFRHSLKEFSDDLFAQKAQIEEDKIGKFDAVMSAINTNIALYESIFGEDPELFEEPQKKEPAKEKPVAAKPLAPLPREEEPKTDEAGYILEEAAHYFTASENDVEEGSSTVRTAIPADEKVEGSKFEVVEGPDTGAVFEAKATMTMGRAESNTIPVRDPKASRQHCKIERKGKEYVLVDLNSSNGTLVNGERVEEHVLSDGDEIQIGDVIIAFHA